MTFNSLLFLSEHALLRKCKNLANTDECLYKAHTEIISILNYDDWGKIDEMTYGTAYTSGEVTSKRLMGKYNLFVP